MKALEISIRINARSIYVPGEDTESMLSCDEAGSEGKLGAAVYNLVQTMLDEYRRAER